MMHNRVGSIMIDDNMENKLSENQKGGGGSKSKLLRSLSMRVIDSNKNKKQK